MEEYIYSKDQNNNSSNKFWQVFSSPVYSKIIGVFVLMIIIGAIPLTVYLSQQRQEVRQQASGTCLADGATCENNDQCCGKICTEFRRPSLSYRGVCSSAPVTPINTPTPSRPRITYPSQPTITIQPTNTTVPTQIPTATPTKTPTPTITSRPTPTPTTPATINPTATSIPSITQNPNTSPIQPPASPTVTNTIVPTNTIPPGTTVLSLKLILDGVFFDCNVNQSCLEATNKKPLHPTRDVSILVFNNTSTTQPLEEKTTTVTFDPNDGYFKGDLNLGNLQSGNYQFKVKTGKYLRKTLPGYQTITAGTTNIAPVTNLIAGDINGDDRLDILDYNIMISCLEGKQTSPECGTNRGSADLDDDDPSQYDAGNLAEPDVDIDDYNLFLRNLSVQRGD